MVDCIAFADYLTIFTNVETTKKRVEELQRVPNIMATDLMEKTKFMINVKEALHSLVWKRKK